MKYDHVGHTTRRHDRRTDKQLVRRRRERRDRPDASGGWRVEYRVHRVAIPDGGTPTAPEDSTEFVPEPGARVRDREADHGDGELLVLEVLNTRADEHIVEGTGQTVAEYTGYPPESPVVRAVYTADLDARTEWRSVQELRGRAAEGDLCPYDFPAGQLGPLPGRSRRDSDEEAER